MRALGLQDVAMKVLSLALTSLLVVASACSSTPAPPSVSREDACDSYTKTVCDKLNECAPIDLATIYGDLNTCVARTKLLCLAQLAVPNTSTNVDRLVACASEGKSQSCAEVARDKVKPTCRTAPGTLADGEGCNFDEQCVSTYCKTISGTGCGKCTKRQDVGAICVNDGECAAGAVCAQGKCVLPADQLESCGSEKPCAGQLNCIAQKCAEPLPLEADCSMTGSLCVGGAYCEGSSNRCKLIAVEQGGQLCGAPQGKIVYCKASGFCSYKPGATCLPASADGAGCDDLSGPRCLPPARCAAGTCKLPQDAKCR
jgi:hypothetical protein